MKRVMVTGGCGFIGSNFLNLVVPRYPEWTFINIDSLTYAANPENLVSVEKAANYRFHQVDIAERDAVDRVFA